MANETEIPAPLIESIIEQQVVNIIQFCDTAALTGEQLQRIEEMCRDRYAADFFDGAPMYSTEGEGPGPSASERQNMRDTGRPGL